MKKKKFIRKGKISQRNLYVLEQVRKEVEKTIRKAFGVVSRTSTDTLVRCTLLSNSLIDGYADRLLDLCRKKTTASRASGKSMTDMIAHMILEAIEAEAMEPKTCMKVFRSIESKADELDIMADLPPVESPRKPRSPKKGLVESRAETVEQKIEEWEKKLKLAKTYLAKYKKKAAYYRRRGVINA
jgi:hypothetical protein